MAQRKPSGPRDGPSPAKQVVASAAGSRGPGCHDHDRSALGGSGAVRAAGSRLGHADTRRRHRNRHLARGRRGHEVSRDLQFRRQEELEPRRVRPRWHVDHHQRRRQLEDLCGGGSGWQRQRVGRLARLGADCAERASGACGLCVFEPRRRRNHRVLELRRGRGQVSRHLQQRRQEELEPRGGGAHLDEHHHQRAEPARLRGRRARRQDQRQQHAVGQLAQLVVEPAVGSRRPAAGRARERHPQPRLRLVLFELDAGVRGYGL